MQNSEVTTQTYKLGKYKFIFPRDMQFEIFTCETYSVITFLIEGNGYLGYKFGKYEVINNRYLGYRLCIITDQTVQDIPFHEGTYWFLPKFVKVVEEAEI